MDNKVFEFEFERRTGTVQPAWNWALFVPIRFEYIRLLTTFLSPMQCTGNRGFFPRGKRAAIVWRYPGFISLSPVCTVFSCFHTAGCEAYSFTTYEYGIFNVRTNLAACRTHEGGVRHKQVCTRLDSEGLGEKTLSRCPARGSNPGCSDLNSDARTTELRPLFSATATAECHSQTHKQNTTVKPLTRTVRHANGGSVFGGTVA